MGKLHSEEKRKNTEIKIRLSNEEKANIISNSKKANMTISEFVLNSIKRKRIVVINEIPQIMSDIYGASININQIAKVANSQKFVNKKNVDDLFSESQILKDKINELIGSICELEPNYETIDTKKIYDVLSMISKRIDRIEKSLTGNG